MGLARSFAPAIKAQLQQLQAVIEDPESARRFGVEPPTGLLLAGPPGTGKTTIAKVLAAQARCVVLSDLRRRRDQQMGR